MNDHQADLNNILEHADTTAAIKNQHTAKTNASKKPVCVIEIVFKEDDSIEYVEVKHIDKEILSHRFFTWIGFKVGVDLNKFMQDIISRINCEYDNNVEINYSDNVTKRYSEIIPPLPYISDFIKASENVMNTTTNQLPELVLTIPRTELQKHGWDYGVHDFDISKLYPKNYSFIPRKWINDKSETSDAPQTVGIRVPQIIPYTIIKDKEGKILTYRRKSKDPNLLGRYSIGVGGHVELCDMLSSVVNDGDVIMDIVDSVSLCDIVLNGQCRELVEEIGISVVGTDISKYHTIIALNTDMTNKIHVAFVSDAVVNDTSKLVFDPEEFFDVEWLTNDELYARLDTTNFEPWTKALIKHFN